MFQLIGSLLCLIKYELALEKQRDPRKGALVLAAPSGDG